MRLLFVLLCIYTYTVSLANDSLSYVFRSGEAGYHTFRIPAIVQAPDKSLVKKLLRDPNDNGGVKGKRPSKKDKLRAAALLAASKHSGGANS